MKAQTLAFAPLLFILATITASYAALPRAIKLPLHRHSCHDDVESLAYVDGGRRLDIHYHNCLSWRTGVEARNIIDFSAIPDNCVDHVEDYMKHSQYLDDLETVCNEAYLYAKGLPLPTETVNVFVFDVDDTLLSNVPYFESHGFRGPLNAEAFEAWKRGGNNPDIPESRRLYLNLLEIGVRPVILTERSEELREITIENLKSAGYRDWEKIIFRPNDSTQDVVEFKSSQREKLKREGYNIIGNMGDQWSDLQGKHPGRRTFKLPNPMYYQK